MELLKMLAVSQTVAALFLMCYTLGKANLILFCVCNKVIDKSLVKLL